MSLTRRTLDNRHAVWALVIAAAVFGWRAYRTIPMQLFPDTAPPLVNVFTAYPGASARDVDDDVGQVLERAFAALEGVVRVRATSQDNLSVVSVEFQYDRDAALAAVDVQNAVSRIRGDLPAGVREPQVLRFRTSDRPVISVGVTGADLVAARRLAEDQLAPELQRIRGVAAVDVFGGREPAVLVEARIRDLEAHGLPLAALVGAIRGAHASLPAGRLRSERTETMVRLDSRAGDAEALGRIPLPLPDGSRVLLGDVATITRGALDDEARFAVDGRQAIAMQVFKTDDANTVQVVRAVEAALDTLRARHPDVELLVGEESATFTEVSVDNLLSNVWQALLFASLLILLFIGRARSAAVAVISMPLAYGLTFALMQAFDVEFNMVTLSAIILAVGMVVDATVVLLENITRRRDDEGLSPGEAAVQGTDEVRLAVVAGTATTLVVLIPLLFLEGFIGKTFGPLALTLIFAFGSSVLVALVLVPVLSLYTAGGGRIDRATAALVRPFQWLMDRLRDAYVSLLRLALRARVLTIALFLGLFAVAVVGLRGLGMEVLPKMDTGSFFVTLETPSGSSLDETARVVAAVEAALAREPEVVKVQSQVGYERGMRALSSFGVQGPTQGSVTVTLSDRDQRDESIWQIQQRVRRHLAKIPGIRTATVRELGNTAKATTSAPIIVRLGGPDALVLDRLARDVVTHLRQVPNVIEPTRSWRLDQARARVQVDAQRAARVGTTPLRIAQDLNLALYGASAGAMSVPGGTPEPIWVRAQGGASADPDALLDLPLFVPGDPAPIPLRAVAELVSTRDQGLVTREDLTPTLEISAFSEGRPLNFVIADVEAALADLVLPLGYSLTLTGEKSDLAEAKGELLGAFAVALLAVYLLLVAQLRSFLHPLTILTTVPLSLIGVYAALALAGKPVSMPVMVGLILLVGTVVNNAILLIEFIRQRRLEGAPRRDALLDSVRLRFRPILMTSLSTIVGMIPLAAEWALGAERFSPLATAVIGGMTTATFLTLLLIPVLYDLLDDVRGRLVGGHA